MTAQDKRQSVETFADEYLKMIRFIRPCVQGLIEQPDWSDQGLVAIEPCLQMFHSMKGFTVLLGLEHLALLASAMTNFLGKIQYGALACTPRHIALLAESCIFLEQGFPLVGTDGTDARLADSAASLVAAVNTVSQRENEPTVDEHQYPELLGWMRETFLWEIEHLLAVAEQECVLWDFIAVDIERVADLGRVLRRLQQSFAIYGFHDPEQLCGALASTLNRYVHGDFFQTAYPERILLRTIDAVREATRQFVRSDDFVMSDVDQIAANIQGMMRQPIGELLVAAGLVDSTAINRALELQNASRDEHPPLLGEVLVAMGEVTPEQVQRILQEQQNKRAQYEQSVSMPNRPLSKTNAPAVMAATIDASHLDAHRLARMSTLIEQLLVMRLSEEPRPLLAELYKLIRVSYRTALQNLPHHFQLIAQELAVKGNKRLNCHIEGLELLGEVENGELLIESIFHLIANGVEHGIESMEERFRAGKEKTGVLRVLVTPFDTELRVTVEDDGRGFDFVNAAMAIASAEQVVLDSAIAMTNWSQLEQLLDRFVEKHAQGKVVRADKQGLVSVYASLRERNGKIEITATPGKGTRVIVHLQRRC